MSNILKAEIHETFVRVDIGGIRKDIEPSEFSGILRKCVESSEQVSEEQPPFILPEGAYSMTFGRDTCTLFMYVPGVPRKVKFINGRSSSDRRATEYEIPMPNIVIKIPMRKVQDKWAVSTEQVRYLATCKTLGQLNGRFPDYNNREGFWVTPLPNCYSDGKICYGSSYTPSNLDNDLRQLYGYATLLWDSIFNRDLSIPSVRGMEDPTEWIEFLARQKEFPYWELRDSPIPRPASA